MRFSVSNQWGIQDFLGGWGWEAPTPKVGVLTYFCRKLHENERIWTPGGGTRPWHPLRSATTNIQNMFVVRERDLSN